MSYRFTNNKLFAFVGRGDSCKSTILKAIHYSAYPSYNLSISDSDFHNSNYEEPIVIESNFYEIPEELLLESKFGLYVKRIDPNNGQITYEPVKDGIEVLSIRLTIGSDLEPIRQVISGRGDPILIRNNDRKKLNIFYMSEYIDSHFGLTYGSPFERLFGGKQNREAIISSLREIKLSTDLSNLGDFRETIDRVNGSAERLGLEISSTNILIDDKNLSHKNTRVSLHENNIPLRLKGKGSKKLISMAIQLELLRDNGGIILIDEFEEGLEPDRIKNLIRSLLTSEFGQFYITTHSSSIVEELEISNILRVNNNEGTLSLSEADDTYHGLYRYCPEALYSSKIIVCEGATEVGICRAYDKYRINSNQGNLSSKNCIYIDGGGQNMTKRAIQLKKLGLDVSLFCDSDIDDSLSPNKEELTKLGILIFDCESGLSIEEQIFKDSSESLTHRIIVLSGKEISNINNSIKAKYNGKDIRYFSYGLEDDRLLVGKICKKGEWFKNITMGQKLGDLIFDHTDQYTSKHLMSLFVSLSERIDG